MKTIIKKIIKAILPVAVYKCIINLLSFYHTVKPNANVVFAPLRYLLFIRKSDKYLLCRPGGGLNDTLCRVELCCRYAFKYRRKIFIETSHSSFRDDLEKYFILPSYMSTKIIDFIQYPASVYPSCLKNDIYNYEVISTPEGRKIKDGPYPQFDFNRKYDEQYLIYDNYGGGEYSIYFMKRIRLEESLRLHIVSTINKLGNYAAVHIRHDPRHYQTDYEPFLNNIRENLIHDHIVVCTDSYEVQQYSKTLFGDRLIVPTDIPDTHDIPLVNYVSDSYDKYRANVDAITDIFILACSDKLYTTNIIQGQSGFTGLAINLHKRKKLIKKLLSGES